jgi:c-di-GMP-binding flagellar brake protein YcgR
VPSGDDREHPRHAHATAITLRAGSTAIQGRSRDLSRGGISASVSTGLPIGTEVQVDLQLVFADDKHGELFRLPGRIVWCTRVDDRYQVGVAFRPLDAKQIETVARLLRELVDEPSGPKPLPHERAVDDRFG